MMDISSAKLDPKWKSPKYTQGWQPLLEQPVTPSNNKMHPNNI